MNFFARKKGASRGLPWIDASLGTGKGGLADGLAAQRVLEAARRSAAETCGVEV